MKSINVLNKNGEIVSQNNLYEDPTEFINHIVSTNYWGKPIRWILATELHDESDVISTETRVSPNGIPEEWVQLKAEYTIKITDVTIQITNEARIVELRKLLADSDFRMTNDYFADMSPEDQNLWTTDRASWRTELRGLI